MKSRFLILFFILLISTIGHSQFALDITTTDETCEGNGTVNPTVTNIAPGSIVKYTVVNTLLAYSFELYLEDREY